MSLKRPYKAVPIVMLLLVLAAFAFAVMVNRWVAEQLLTLVPRAVPSTALAVGRSQPASEDVDTGEVVDAGIAIQTPAKEVRVASQHKAKRRRARGASASDSDDDADIHAQSETKFSIRRSFFARVL